MSIEIRDMGKDNVVRIAADVNGSGTLTIHGNKCIVDIGEGSRFRRAALELRGDNCRMIIGKNCRLVGIFRCLADDTYLLIGDETTAQNVKISISETGGITIGRDCMFSGEIRMEVSDMHSIITLASGERINPPGNIVIEDHVWIGYDVFITKGVTIGTDSVIGAKSVVTKNIPSRVVAAGCPARILRENITWDRKKIPLE